MRQINANLKILLAVLTLSFLTSCTKSSSKVKTTIKSEEASNVENSSEEETNTNTGKKSSSETETNSQGSTGSSFQQNSQNSQSQTCNNGNTQQRVRYQQATAGSCSSQVQQRSCQSGAWGAWSGNYTHSTCVETRTIYANSYYIGPDTCADHDSSQNRNCSDGTCEAWPTNGYLSCEDMVAFTGSLANDSVGSQVRVMWTNTAGWTDIKIGYSPTLNDLNRWNGENADELDDVGVISNYGGCTANALDERGTAVGTQFNPTKTSSATSLEANEKCAFLLTDNNLVGGARNVWEKVYVRLYGKNASSEASLSSVLIVARVADGMVYIDREAWPDDEYPLASFPYCTDPKDLAGISNCRYSFAIDKYETYYTTTAANPGDNIGSNPGDYPSNFDPVLFSEVNKSPTGGINFFGNKQGCLNRSYEPGYSDYASITDLSAAQRFIIPTPKPLRKYHLVLPVAWMVASKGVSGLDASCELSGGTKVNTGTLTDCRSVYGVYDMLGNMWEVTNQVWNNTHSPPTRRQFYGTEYHAESESIAIPSFNNSFVTSFDFATAVVQTTAIADPGNFFSDKYWYDAKVEVAPITGGGYTDSTSGGRFAQSYFEDATLGQDYTGARCAILAP